MIFLSNEFKMLTEHEEKAKIFKALCDPKRIAIIELLQNGELCACNLISTLNIPQSALSYHMKILCESGIIESWTVGKWTHYQISKAGREHAMRILVQLTTTYENNRSCSCAS